MLQMDFTKKHLLTSFFLKTCVVCLPCSLYMPRDHNRLYQNDVFLVFGAIQTTNKFDQRHLRATIAHLL